MSPSAGREQRSWDELGPVIGHIFPAPTSQQVLAELGEGEGRSTILARVEVGPFLATIERYDWRDDGEALTDTPRIFLDCSEQDHGTMFHHLTVLPEYVDDFELVTAAITLAHKELSHG